MKNPPPFIPPYFGYEETTNGIKIYTSGKHLVGIVDTFEDLLAFMRFHNERACETHERNVVDWHRRHTRPTLNIELDL